ncbi:MAG TPA: MFS transporter [Dehalococcoidia bacterium]|jgi:MFS family permease|nr:MFS transporter [Dehalococcoidia bacterium]
MSNADNGAEGFTLSSLTYSVYVPTLLFSIGQGAVIPIIPLFARELGSSVAAAALIVALRGIGQLIFDLPAGIAVTKWGDKGAMVAGTAMIGVVALGASFSPSPAVLGILVLFMGGGWAFWQIARLAYVTEVAPVEQRGRALSMTGGMNRVGNFIGPLIGGFMGEWLGLESAFVAQAVMGLAAAAMMFLVVAEDSGSEKLESHGLGGRIVDTMVDNRGIFVRAGPPVIALGILRQARQVFIPLWGEQIGLSTGQIGVITSASFFIDAAVFYPVGMVMDSKGRKWVSVPCLITMGIGLAILPLTNDFVSFLSVGLLTGLGNGFGAGINMTLGADFSPRVGRGEFLGVWRLVSDIGQASGPLVISVLTGLGSLALASVTSSGIGFAGAGLMFLFVPETLRRVAQSYIVTPEPEPEEATAGPGP